MPPRSRRVKSVPKGEGGAGGLMNMDKAMRMAEKYETCILVVFAIMCILAGALFYVWYTSSGGAAGATSRAAPVEGVIPPPDPTGAAGGRDLLSARVEGEFAHDRQAFTQGFLYHGGHLFESTGLYGFSSIRKSTVEGQVLVQKNLPPNIFCEGITLLDDDHLVAVTWREKKYFVFSTNTLEEVASGAFPVNQAWGIANDGHALLVTDGSSTLHVVDKRTMTKLGERTITMEGQELRAINDMEYVPAWDKIIANRWFDHHLFLIDPSTGKVDAKLDLSEAQHRARSSIARLLSSAANQSPPFVKATVERENCLNGVTYVPAAERTGSLERCHLLVTGKLWPQTFCVSVQGLP